MSNKTFIPLSRGIQEHWVWLEKPFSKGQAWVDLLLTANYSDKKQLLRGQMVTCKRGDVNLSMLELSNRWGWTRGKVKRFLEMLEADGMVTVKATTHRTTISIENYDIYNFQRTTEPTTEKATNATTDELQANQQTDITKKNKKEKKEKRDIKSLKSVLDSAPQEMVPALRDFTEMRQAIKAPMTPRALELLITKLNRLSAGDTHTAIEILNQSIENGWKGVYELKAKPQMDKNDVAAAFVRGDF